MLAQQELLEAVERLGGWAVVVWIVWWLTKRWEAKMTDIVQATDRGFHELGEEQRKTREVMERMLEEQRGERARANGPGLSVPRAPPRTSAQRSVRRGAAPR